MDVVHPDLVPGKTVQVRDERDNPLAAMRVVAATTTALTLQVRQVRCTLSPGSLISYSERDGLAIIAGQLSDEMLALLT